MLSKAGFNNFAIEVGPHSAEKLEQLSIPYKGTRSMLSNFYSTYEFKEIGDIPIPFFHGKADADFLMEASKYEMDLWGLDQEYWSSVFFLLDELEQLAISKPDFETIQIKKKTAEEKIREWMIKEDNDEEGFKVFSLILKEPAVIDFFNVFDESDIKAQEIIKDLKISWDIYDNYRGGVSHDTRVAYMFDNFNENYAIKRKTNPLPKVFMKIGALHAFKVKVYNTMEIGSLTEKMAEENGTISTNIRAMNRYFEMDGEVKDLLKENPKRIGTNLPFLNFAKKDEWTIIDLKPIRADLEAGRIQLPEANTKQLELLIYGFDYELIFPVNRYVEAHYE